MLTGRNLAVLIFGCLLGWPLPLHGQWWKGVSPRAIKNAVTAASISAGKTAAYSAQANQVLRQQLSGLLRAPKIESPELRYFPPAENPFVFRMQRRAESLFPASAFAVEVDGRVFGVTAGHVMYNAARINDLKETLRLQANGHPTTPFTHLPFARFQTGENKFLTTPISNWKMSNMFGADVAVFEIPKEALPYIKPLTLRTQPLQPEQEVSVAGFVNDMPLWMPQEEVLFSTPYRLLLRNQLDREITGMCGSPVLVDGQVAGVYVGFSLQEKAAQTNWGALVKQTLGQPAPLPGVHIVAPISLILPLIDELTGTTNPAHTLWMKVAGHPVAPLQPQERILSIQHFRGEQLLQNLCLDELLNPGHLEHFFNLQENDLLHIHIATEADAGKHIDDFIYEVNVSTGEVSKLAITPPNGKGHL